MLSPAVEIAMETKVHRRRVPRGDPIEIFAEARGCIGVDKHPRTSSTKMTHVYVIRSEKSEYRSFFSS